METRKSTRPSSERENWGKWFNYMVEMLQKQQRQLETLVKERQIREDYAKEQQDQWIFKDRLYEYVISQMKGNMLTHEKERSFDASKFNFVVGLKERDAQLSALKHALTVSELEDFKELFDAHCKKCSHKSGNHSKNSLQTSETMEGELRMLQKAFEKLKAEKDSELSSLMMEKKFVWNQYSIMEEDYTNKLRSKNSDAEKANLTIQKLLGSLEELQKSNHEKDDAISTLKGEIGKRDIEKNKLKEELCRLSNELDLVRKSKTFSTSPVLKRCNSNDENSVLVERTSNRLAKKDASNAENSHPSKNSQSGSRSSKRKRNEVISVLDSPKLFSSSIKIPKLKSTFHRMEDLSAKLVNSKVERREALMAELLKLTFQCDELKLINLELKAKERKSSSGEEKQKTHVDIEVKNSAVETSEIPEDNSMIESQQDRPPSNENQTAETSGQSNAFLGRNPAPEEHFRIRYWANPAIDERRIN